MGVDGLRMLASLTVPIRTVSEANLASSEHWRYRWKRGKAQKTAVEWAMLVMVQQFKLELAPPYHIHLTRLAPGKLDSDNLTGSAKHVRDGIARFLAVDDGDEKMVVWSYSQERAKDYGLRIEIYRAMAQ